MIFWNRIKWFGKYVRKCVEHGDDSDNINPSTWAPDLSIVDPYIPDWGE